MDKYKDLGMVIVLAGPQMSGKTYLANQIEKLIAETQEGRKVIRYDTHEKMRPNEKKMIKEHVKDGNIVIVTQVTYGK